MDHDYKWFLTDDLINLAKELFILDHVSEKAYFYKIDEYKIDLAKDYEFYPLLSKVDTIVVTKTHWAEEVEEVYLITIVGIVIELKTETPLYDKLLKFFFDSFRWDLLPKELV